eukprot:TRINITY_DN1707_c0_g1_i1.p1 TRINITY_DN1707_c0_g1~~TRINITY_DN1707_c0_g1_i1.p1  ORF type:complete len:361 (+),score=109.65 TRINITY_DN1707_c0_g1_i1:54-1085(+)
MTQPSHEGWFEWAEKKKFDKKGEKLKYHLFALCGSTLHYYSNFNDDKPKGALQVKGGKVSAAEDLRPHALLLEAKEGEYVVVAPDETEAKEWLAKITEALSQEPQGPPPKERRRKESILFKAKKNIAGKAATSKAGKEQLRKVLPEEVNKLTDDFTKLVQNKGGQDKAEDMYNTLIKLMVKIKLQLDRETISQAELKPVLLAARESFECLANLYFKKPTGAELEAQLTQATKSIKSIESANATVMSKHLSTKNIKKFNEFFGAMSSQFIRDYWLSADQDALVKDIATLLQKYSTWENTFENFLPIRKTLGGLLVEVLADEVTNTKVYKNERDYLKEKEKEDAK